MKSVLGGKKLSDIQELTQMVKQDLPSTNVQKERIITDAVKSTSLPSQIQKSMSEMLAERLKQKPIKDDSDDVIKKVTRDPMRVDSATVNMGTTLTKKDDKLTKGKMLG